MSWNTLCNVENLFLSLALLGVLVSSHAVVLSMSHLVSDHVSFVPFLVVFVVLILNLVVIAVVVGRVGLLMPVERGMRGNILVGDEGSIEGSDTLKINSIALDDILDA